jgi:hypothetical protein
MARGVNLAWRVEELVCKDLNILADENSRRRWKRLRLPSGEAWHGNC